MLTRAVIPAVLSAEDPSRPYLPSSPYVDPIAFAVGERYLPEDHPWGPRDYFKSDFYRGTLCHFASEMGYHGCPEPASVRRFITPDKVWPYSANDEWLLHSTSPIPGLDIHDYRVELMASQVRVLFGTVPASLEAFAFASQASQAEALKFFVEMFRSAKWRRTGIIWWNIADGWPQFSDAVVDYYLVRKRAYEVLKRIQQPVCVVIREPLDGWHEVVVCNDGRLDVEVAFTVHDVDTGTDLAGGHAVAAGDAVTVVGRIAARDDLQRCLIMDWDSNLGPGRNHYLAGLPPFGLERYRTWLEAAGLPA